MYDQRIKALAVDEYFFLTENLEIANKDMASSGVSYILQSRQHQLAQIVKKAIQNELLPIERNIVLEHLGEGVSAVMLQEKYGISHSAFYRALNSAKKKLCTSLKYVLLYNDEGFSGNAEELFEYVRQSQH